MLIGLLCALAAAFAYGSASILQADGVRRAGGETLSAVARQPAYLIGLGLDGIGFVGAVLALQSLPLFLVQAVVASSVAVTAMIAAARGARLGRAGWIALAGVVVGLILLALSAAPEQGHGLALVWRWVLLFSTVPVALLFVIGPRLGQAAVAPVLAFGAGLAFSVVAIASRSLHFPHPLARILLDPGFWAVLAGGGVALGLFALALVAGSVTSVSAITFTTETVVPAAVGLGFLGDAVRPGYWAVAAAGLGLAVAGAVALARFAEGGGEQRGDPTALTSVPPDVPMTPMPGHSSRLDPARPLIDKDDSDGHGR